MYKRQDTTKARFDLDRRAEDLNVDRADIAGERRRQRVRESYIGENEAAIRAQGDIQAAAAGIAAQDALVRQRGIQADRTDLSVDAQQHQMDIQASQYAQAIAQWSLDNLPPLPSYRRYGNRAHAGTILSIAFGL